MHAARVTTRTPARPIPLAPYVAWPDLRAAPPLVRGTRAHNKTRTRSRTRSDYSLHPLLNMHRSLADRVTTPSRYALQPPLAARLLPGTHTGSCTATSAGQIAPSRRRRVRIAYCLLPPARLPTSCVDARSLNVQLGCRIVIVIVIVSGARRVRIPPSCVVDARQRSEAGAAPSKWIS